MWRQYKSLERANRNGRERRMTEFAPLHSDLRKERNEPVQLWRPRHQRHRGRVLNQCPDVDVHPFLVPRGGPLSSQASASPKIATPEWCPELSTHGRRSCPYGHWGGVASSKPQCCLAGTATTTAAFAVGAHCGDSRVASVRAEEGWRRQQ